MEAKSVSFGCIEQHRVLCPFCVNADEKEWNQLCRGFSGEDAEGIVTMEVTLYE